jgi:hypothetical protein
MKNQNQNSDKLSPIEDAAKWLNQLVVFPDDAKIVIDPDNETVTLNFAYPYEIDLDRIQTVGDLLRWVLHLSEKDWMTAERLNYFITKVGKHKGFKIYGGL